LKSLDGAQELASALTQGLALFQIEMRQPGAGKNCIAAFRDAHTVAADGFGYLPLRIIQPGQAPMNEEILSAAILVLKNTS